MKAQSCYQCSNNRKKFYKKGVLVSKATRYTKFAISKNSMINQDNKKCHNSQTRVNQLGSTNHLHILLKFTRFSKNKRLNKK